MEESFENLPGFDSCSLTICLAFGLALLLLFLPTMRYWARCLFYYWSLIANGVVTVAYGLTIGRGQLFATTRFTIKITHWMNWAVGIDWDVSFEEELDPNQAYVFMANHQSSFDCVAIHMIWESFPGLIAVIGKSSLRYTGSLGMAITVCGGYLVDRQNSKKEGHQSINDAIQHAREHGKSLLFFVEGTRNYVPGTLLPFKKGAFHAAVNGNFPIVPVVIETYNFLKVSPRRIKLRFLKPIPVEEKTYSKEEMDGLIESTRNTMQKELLALNSQSSFH